MLPQFQEADQVTGFGFAALIVGLIAFLESKGFSKYGNNVTGDYGTQSFFVALLLFISIFEPSILFSALFLILHHVIAITTGFDPLGLAKNLDADALAAVQNKELNNGRLAMIATAGKIIAQQA